MDTAQNISFLSKQQEVMTDTKCSTITVDSVRQKFVNFIGSDSIFVAPESLICPIFPSSFTSSAGPNLAARAFQMAGTRRPRSNQAVIQPCIRYWDINSVGDHTHLSFFEMTALTSIGGFTRYAVIDKILRFLVSTMGLSKPTLWATVFGGGTVHGIKFEPDTEARRIWADLGILSRQIIDVYGTEGFVANRHEPVGGYRTEIYIELSEHCLKCSKKCLPAYCDCGRFVELATSVTYAYLVDLDARIPIIPAGESPVHAAGFGIERLCSIYAQNASITDTQSIQYPLKELVDLLPITEFDSNQYINALRVIDHCRALLFLFADGADDLRGNSNKGRRWILNKYIRSLHGSLCFMPIESFEALRNVFISLTNLYGWYPKLRYIDPETLSWKILHRVKGLGLSKNLWMI